MATEAPEPDVPLGRLRRVRGDGRAPGDRAEDATPVRRQDLDDLDDDPSDPEQGHHHDAERADARAGLRDRGRHLVHRGRVAGRFGGRIRCAAGPGGSVRRARPGHRASRCRGRRHRSGSAGSARPRPGRRHRATERTPPCGPSVRSSSSRPPARRRAVPPPRTRTSRRPSQGSMARRGPSNPGTSSPAFATSTARPVTSVLPVQVDLEARRRGAGSPGRPRRRRRRS